MHIQKRNDPSNKRKHQDTENDTKKKSKTFYSDERTGDVSTTIPQSTSRGITGIFLRVLDTLNRLIFEP
jgi:hypothetical protein